MDHFITFQLHSDKSKTTVDPVLCDIDDIPATKLLKRYLCDQYIGSLENLNTDVQENWMFCSVDAGGEKLAKQFASAFNTQLVIAHKQRNYAKANTVESINILSAIPVEGKTLWIVDDMIDTGNSLCSLIRELAKLNPREINTAIVHPVFSGPAIERIAELKNEGLLNQLVVCDTVSCEGLKETLPGIQIVSSARLSSHVIRVIACNQQMSSLTAAFSPEEYLRKPRLFDFAVAGETED
jgi:ribose-phosphate pyrophosphokinase